MAKMKKPSLRQRKAERKYWQQETERFKREHPEIYRKSRARQRIAKIVRKPFTLWRNEQKKAVDQWKTIEDYLLSGKKNPDSLLKLIQQAHRTGTVTLQLKKSFLEFRANVMAKVLKKSDSNAISRVFSIEDKIAEIKLESEFYGELKSFVKEDVLAKFAELTARLRLSHDAFYAKQRQKIALAATGVRKARIRATNYVNELSEKYMLGQIDVAKYLMHLTLADYMLTRQHYNLAQAAERTYLYMSKYAKDAKLKEMLFNMRLEMGRRGQVHKQGLEKIEKDFRDRPELFGYPPQK